MVFAVDNKFADAIHKSNGVDENQDPRGFVYAKQEKSSASHGNPDSRIRKVLAEQQGQVDQQAHNVNNNVLTMDDFDVLGEFFPELAKKEAQQSELQIVQHINTPMHLQMSQPISDDEESPDIIFERYVPYIDTAPMEAPSRPRKRHAEEPVVDAPLKRSSWAPMDEDADEDILTEEDFQKRHNIH